MMAAKKRIDKRRLPHFARQLADRRAALGLTVYRLAQLSGVSQQAVRYLEAGRNAPTLESACKLAAALGCELADLADPAWFEPPQAPEVGRPGRPPGRGNQEAEKPKKSSRNR